ncbi:E3 ubiquitin-protein ligase RGLG2-like [Heracleum sosnowskyi]|uniref:E3 ubiquitin-protein ligase RGLG2-like n=1 Tax=Heracleum sosnowskyi TaxID=360622 RepID=A0AAD8IAL8_9APIA|nr:E3 ubiquitin-protein ligase RGLG2-like [Heracleum sosnowskyi]
MANFGDENNVDGLSDVDDEVPALAGMVIGSPENVPMAKFLEIFAELGREREAREAAEASKSDLQVSLDQLKVLAHEAVRKCNKNKIERDEALQEKKEALKAIEELSAKLFEATKARDEAIRSKDCLRSEIETAAQMLVIGIDKISGKIINFNGFTSGLPRSQKYTGLQAVAYGVIKRTNEIVEELLRRIDLSSKSMLEAREQMEQRSYEIAIEFSQLEAALGGLSKELAEKSTHVEKIETYIAGKDNRISELEREMLEKQTSADSEVSELRKLVDEFKEQRSLMVDQLGYVPKIHDQMNKVIKIADGDELELRSKSVTSLLLTHDTDKDSNICASLGGMELIYKLSKSAVKKMAELADDRNYEVKRLNDAVSQLVKEKDYIGRLLRSATSRMSPDLLSKTNELSKFEESVSGDVAFDCKFHNYLQGVAEPVNMDKTVPQMAYSLEKIIKQSQLEFIDVQHIVDKQRAEMCLLKQHVEGQAKEIIQWKQNTKDIEEKERVANENVEGLMMDIAAAEEEITRWKVAAEQEADAGKAVEKDFLAQLSTLGLELKEAKKDVEESEKKLKLKDQIADAAIAARDAAENSLRLADSRTSRIRGKVEELSCQLDNQEACRFGQNRPRYVCWPLQWLGLKFIVQHQPADAQKESSNEMELSEPLM